MEQKYKIIKNKKRSDIASILYIVIFIFVIGVVFVFMNNLNHKLFTKIEANLNRTQSQFNDSSAIPAIQKIRNTDDVAWDYAFLGIMIGGIIALGLTAYSTQVSAVFYWIYGILSLIILATSVLLSNTWQALAANPEMSNIALRFPITNFVLGTYYPTIFTAILVLVMILLFGKSPEGGGPI